MAKSCKDCYSYRMCTFGSPSKCANYDYYTDEDVDKIHPIREVNPSIHLDLDKTALVFARTLHGQNWANLSEGAQQTSIKAFKSILLKECKADD